MVDTIVSLLLQRKGPKYKWGNCPKSVTQEVAEMGFELTVEQSF